MTRQVFEVTIQGVCAALRKPLCDGGGVGLTAAFQFCSASEIAEVVSELTAAEALAIFEWLDDVRAAAMLTELPEPMTNYIITNAPPGRIAHLSAEEAEHKLGL
ncbi:MAG: hypothetical protein P4L33_05465 [Capsulimonadaceae bacterium]|nr:hypothetical protein [Capsulimonadaceae bacterium]